MKNILICICTFNRNKSLIDCLKSIAQLKDINLYKVKILIVDNTISNHSKEIVENYKKIAKQEILQFHEKKRGIVYARNKCLKISKIIKPTFIGFIDDDCKIDRFWLSNIFKLLNKNNADIITGPQKYEQIDNKNDNNYSSIFEKTYKKDTIRVQWAASNNVFFKFCIIKKYKNINFDIKLNKFGMGEDQLFFSLMNQSGCNIYWTKNVYVTEKMHSHRVDLNWLKERSKRLGILGHYIDIKLHGKIIGFSLNYLKSLYFFFQFIISFFNIYNLNRNLIFNNNLYRFYGKVIGPFKFKKIRFLK